VFKGYRSLTLTSVMGSIHLERAYYHCSHCHQGTLPWDETLRLHSHQFTPGAEEVVSLAGCVESFGQAADRLLDRMAGLHVSESTIQRTTEDAGQRLGELLDERQVLGEQIPWDFFEDAAGDKVGYISLDATSVPQQGPGGASAEGRMPYVGMLYNPPPADWQGKRPDWQARYVCGLTSLDNLGLVMRAQAEQVGFDRVTRWIGVTDGGNGLEDFLRKNFPPPKLQLILDFYHAAEHVNDFLKEYSPADAEQSQRLGQEWCHRLKHEGGQALLTFLEQLPLPSRRKSVRDAYHSLLGYFRNNVHRMDYPHYQAQGWHIGSGPIESACKTVVNRRLCGGGMRWREPGTDALCHLRALYRSEHSQWTAFWNPVVTI
jgi:hypothetical protein